jgi:hypothetical protein
MLIVIELIVKNRNISIYQTIYSIDNGKMDKVTLLVTLIVVIQLVGYVHGLVISAIDNVYLPAGIDPSIIEVNCSLGTPPYTITTTFGSINGTLLILPTVSTSDISTTTITVACTDATTTATTSFTYKVNPPLTLSSSLPDKEVIGYVGDDEPSFTVQCGGGSNTSYSFFVSPLVLTDAGIIRRTGGRGNDNSSDDGDHKWTITLPLSSLVSSLKVFTITMWCNDSDALLSTITPVASYSIQFQISPIPISIVVSGLNDGNGMVSTQGVQPPPFNVTCLGDYYNGIAVLTSSTNDAWWTSFMTWTLIQSQPAVFQVNLPDVGNKVITLRCNGGLVNGLRSVSTTIFYMVNELPQSPEVSLSTIVLINGAQPSLLTVTCERGSGGTGAVTPSVTLGDADDDSIGSLDLSNYTITTSANTTTLTLRLPSKSLSTSATLLAYCIDSLGAKSDPYIINWCIGSSYLRCSLYCQAKSNETEWSMCTSPCDGGVQFRPCSNYSNTFGVVIRSSDMGVSNRECNTNLTCNLLPPEGSSRLFRIRLTSSYELASTSSYQLSLINELASQAQLRPSRLSIVSFVNDTIVIDETVSSDGTISPLLQHVIWMVLAMKEPSDGSEVTSNRALTMLALALMTANSDIRQSSSVAAQSIDYTYPLEPVYLVYVEDDGTSSS